MPTLAEQKILAIVPKVTACLSIFGSGCIIRATLQEDRKKVGTYHRLLLGMSCYDIGSSFCLFLSTWPIPKGTPGVWAPSGNITTCNIQGFVMSMCVAAVAFYNTSLAIYYVLTTRFEWSKKKIVFVERWMHLIAGLAAAVPSIAGIPLKLYNSANLWCWIAPFPPNCKDSFRYGEAANCTRGDNALLYRFVFVFGPVWFCIVLATACMVLLYCTVLAHEKAVDKVQQGGVALRKQSRRIAKQAFWYIMAFYATWGPPTLTRLLQAIPQTQGKFFFSLVLVQASLLPLQGFFNFIVYSRSRYLRYKRANPTAGLIEIVGYAAFAVKTPHKAVHETCDNPESPSVLPSQAPVPIEAILRSEVTLSSETDSKAHASRWPYSSKTKKDTKGGTAQRD